MIANTTIAINAVMIDSDVGSSTIDSASPVMAAAKTAAARRQRL